jgi:hypothetical protein
MIDDPEVTARLIDNFLAVLPIEAMPTRILIQTLTRRMHPSSMPARCRIVGIHYAGDEGGIVCKLDLGEVGIKESVHVSITHLIFERKSPLFRQIDAYQRHRVKKLRREVYRDG